MSETTVRDIEMTLAALQAVLVERCDRERAEVARLTRDVERMREKLEGLNGKIAGLSSLITLVVTLITHLLFKK
jgi:hypothetical protein